MNFMLKRLFTTEPILENWLVIIRIIIGILIAAYGLETFQADKMKTNIAWLIDIHFAAPVFMAYLGKITELAGGIFLAAGLCTRLVSIPLIIDMAVVIIFMGNGKIFGDAQLPFLFLLFFLSFIVYGGGKWSLDNLLFNRKK
jgi:putative oxidoreductase